MRHIADCTLQIVGREILEQQGTYRRERIWIAGWHPELCRSHLARLTFGLTGRETVLDRDAISPVGNFESRAVPSIGPWSKKRRA